MTYFFVSIIILAMMTLRNSQKKEIMVKATRYVGEVLTYYKVVGGWQDTEIFKASGVSNNRLTEYKNFDKYNVPVSVASLKRLIQNGFVDPDKLIELETLTREEKTYLKQLLN